MITSIGSFGGDLKEHVILNVSICRLGILHCAIGVGTGDLCSHGGQDERINDVGNNAASVAAEKNST